MEVGSPDCDVRLSGLRTKPEGLLTSSFLTRLTEVTFPYHPTVLEIAIDNGDSKESDHPRVYPTLRLAQLTCRSMTFGPEGTEGSRITDIPTLENVFDTFQKYGYNELDTARMYCDGQCEGFITQAGWQKRGMKIASKIYPSNGLTHKPTSLRATLEKTLGELKTGKVDIYYLHAPDHGTPLEETMVVMDELHKEGKFDVFGLSNYAVYPKGVGDDGSRGRLPRCVRLHAKGE